MQSLSVAFLLFLAFAAHPVLAGVRDWPALDGSATGICDDALRAATAAFQSNAEHVEVTPEAIEITNSELVFDPNRYSYFQGRAIDWVRLPKDDRGAFGGTYWQQSPIDGWRIVVGETQHGWRHETYSLYMIDAEMTPDVFWLQSISSERRYSPLRDAPSFFPPQIFRDKLSGRFWIIDEGGDVESLADWKISFIGQGAVEYQCTLHFRPRVKRPLTLLPLPVRRLATLLDQTLGRGDNEGTLHPTAMLRRDVAITWANIALRPWAVRRAYNTREEVDAGLQRWAQQGRSFRNAYRQIQQQIPLAERALATYFHDQFGRSTEEAIAAAEFVLDVAIRSHFAFHVEDIASDMRRNGMASNPW